MFPSEDQYREPTGPIVTTRTAVDIASKADVSRKTQRQPPYHVVLLNDEIHTFEYVTDILVRLFRHPVATAETLTWKVHHDGRAIVLTTHREFAELKRDQVLTFGPDPGVDGPSGPIGCVIEAARVD